MRRIHTFRVCLCIVAVACLSLSLKRLNAQPSPVCYAVFDNGEVVNLEDMCGEESQQEPTQEPRLSAQEYFELGVEQYGGTYEESIASFTRAIEADPNNHEYYSMRAQAYVSIDNIPAATADYARVVEILESQGAQGGLIEHFRGMLGTMENPDE
jgi:tetratricopeptide (TPR) repeat protein